MPNLYQIAPLLLTAALSTCAERRPEPRPQPPPAGDASAPSGGHGGAYNPGGAGGLGGASGAGPAPLCELPPGPAPDPDLDDFIARLDGVLVGAGSSSAGWLRLRERHGAKTTLIAVPPPSLGLVAAQLEQIRFGLGAGYVEVPKEGCATCGLKNPCGDKPARVAGIAQDAHALPAASGNRSPVGYQPGGKAPN